MTDHEDDGSNPTFLRTFTYVFCKDKSHCCGKESRRDQFGNDLQNIVPVQVLTEQLRTTVSIERLEATQNQAERNNTCPHNNQIILSKPPKENTINIHIDIETCITQ